MSLVAAGSILDFFHDAVDDAVKKRKVEVSEAARAYVVALLSDAAKPGSGVEAAMDRPLTLLLDEALRTEDRADRFERLRTLGDGVLYTSSFFAEHFESRGVEVSYVLGIGSRAYGGASSVLGTPSAPTEFDVFLELSAKFEAFVAVLADVANSTVAKGVQTSKGLLKLYERWLKTRDDSLADALASHGFVAPRGTKVLQ